MEVFPDHSRPALARGTRLATDQKTGEPMLLFPEGVVHLSATAEAILRRCNGQANLGEIVTALADEFEADPSVLRNDIRECLSQLHRRKLIVLT